MPIYRLTNDLVFPPVHFAEDGLLAVGGDLRPERLVLAYRNGIFPWYSEGEPILWWAPDPRMVLLPEELHVSRSLERKLKQGAFRVTLDAAFPEVIRSCAKTPRKHEAGTWITPAMEEAYIELRRRGIAHSVEVWRGDELAGGLYGIALGACFFGESMFSRARDASKVAFTTFVRHFAGHGGRLIDCQVSNPHLESLGAREIPREAFQRLLAKWPAKTLPPETWEPGSFPRTEQPS